MSKNKIILAVDDDGDILRILERIITGAGFEVMLAQSPEEARKLMEGKIPHLILTDLNMEPEDGQSFISSIRKQRKYDDIPIVVLSAVNKFNSVKEVMGLGISDYVIKPLNSSMLLRKIKKALLHLDFTCWNLPSNELNKVTAKLPAKITSIGESKFQVTGPFKLSSSQKIRINSKDLTMHGINLSEYKVSERMKTYQGEGSFSNDLDIIAEQTEIDKIKEFIKKKVGI